MKRCPKCSRSYPDDNQKFCTLDGGLLVAAEEGFDPNATIVSAHESSPAATPAEPADNATRALNETVASTPSPATEAFMRNTGPTGAATVVDQPMPAAQAPPPSRPAASLPVSPPAVAPSLKKKSKAPMIVGILLVLVVLGVGAAVAGFFLVVRPWLEARRTEPVVVVTNDNQSVTVNEDTNTQPTVEQPATEEFVPPPDSQKFANSNANLDGKLAEHYFDFSFYYPNDWQADPKAGVPGANNFAKVERRIPPDFTQENFAVGWYTSKGTYEADKPTFPQLVEILGTSLASGFPEYRKVSEGPTKINSLDGYEFRFVSVSKNTEKGDIEVWGRVVFLPTGTAGDEAGATLIMLATSLAPELSGVEDVGQKGQMPVILDSFRFGK